jgi:hypothetical protein
LQLTETIPHIVGLQGEGMILLAAQVVMRKIPRDKEGGYPRIRSPNQIRPSLIVVLLPTMLRRRSGECPL